MVDLLQIDLVSVEDVVYQKGEAVVMVDSQPNTGRHNVPPNTPLYAVIDHHDTPGELEDIPFVDVRRGLGATCSIVASYLMEQNIALPPRLATGLLYGIETELSGYPREASVLDDSALLYLYPLADKDLLAQDSKCQAAAELFRMHLAGPAKLLYLRSAHHQLGQRAAAA